jgi:hypothetical protein
MTQKEETYAFPSFVVEPTPVWIDCSLCSSQSKVESFETRVLKECLSALWKTILAIDENAKPVIWCMILQNQDKEARHRFFHQWGMCRYSALYIAERPNMDYYRQHHPTIRARGKFGCWSSHQNVAHMSEHCKKLVLEGDADFSAKIYQSPWTLVEYLSALQFVPPEWEMLMLGYFPLAGRALYAPTDKVKILQVKALMAHAYILSERGARRLASSWFNHKNEDLDRYFAANFLQYAISPQILIQNGREQTANTENFASWIQNALSENTMTHAISLHRHAVDQWPVDIEWLVLELVPCLLLLVFSMLMFWILMRFVLTKRTSLKRLSGYDDEHETGRQQSQKT